MANRRKVKTFELPVTHRARLVARFGRKNARRIDHILNTNKDVIRPVGFDGKRRLYDLSVEKIVGDYLRRRKGRP